MMTVNIADLDPFTTYDISVVAITVVAGPPATTSVRTEQAGMYIFLNELLLGNAHS